MTTRHTAETDPRTSRRPSTVNRIRSRQSGHPTGALGRIIGRAMVKDTAAANDRAVELLQLTQPGTVLEIGFGQGRTVSKLLTAGHRVIGTDVSAAMVAQASARNRRACADGRAQLVRSDGITIPFPDDHADAALSVHTLSFMAEPAATIAEIARVLRPEGRLALACLVGDDPIPAWMDRSIYRIPTISAIEAMLSAGRFTAIVHEPGHRSAHQTHYFTAELPR